jgi:nitroreductase
MRELSAPWACDNTGALGPAWRRVLSAAIAAPSIHNTQPWRFRVRPGSVDVFVDRDRQLPVADPSGRELVISVGAAVFNLRVAMLAEGRQPLFEAWPDPADANLAARVAIGGAVTPDETVRALVAAIPGRRTNRRPFADQPLPSHALDDLVTAARVEGAGLAAADDIGRLAVLGLVRRAEDLLREDVAYRHELSHWAHDLPERRDGVPVEAFAPWTAVESVPLREFGQVRRPATVGEYERRPTIAVLYTSGDTAVQWLRAGQALQRVLLTATVRGIASTLMTQPMEIPRLRKLLAAPVDGRVVAQAALRFGYAEPSPPTPRRRLVDVLETEVPTGSAG